MTNVLRTVCIVYILTRVFCRWRHRLMSSSLENHVNLCNNSSTDVSKQVQSHLQQLTWQYDTRTETPFSRWIYVDRFDPLVFPLRLFQNRTFGNKWWLFNGPMSSVTQPSVSKHWRKHKILTPNVWPHPFFINRRIPRGRDVAALTPGLQCQSILTLSLHSLKVY